MRSFNFKMVLNNSINKTHALLHTKNIPHVLYITVEFYDFEKI